MSYGVWKPYSHTFDIEDGYNYLQIFIGCTRNGEAYISEIQLEEGTKATTWKDPDVEESLQAAGIYLNGNDMSINARSKHFNYIDQQGNIVASVDETGAIDGLKFRTRNLGAGYIDLTGAMMQVFGAVARNITFGLDEKGQAALKFYNNAGRKHPNHLARWNKGREYAHCKLLFAGSVLHRRNASSQLSSRTQNIRPILHR